MPTLLKFFAFCLSDAVNKYSILADKGFFVHDLWHALLRKCPELDQAESIAPLAAELDLLPKDTASVPFSEVGFHFWRSFSKLSSSTGGSLIAGCLFRTQSQFRCDRSTD